MVRFVLHHVETVISIAGMMLLVYAGLELIGWPWLMATVAGIIVVAAMAVQWAKRGS